MPHSYLKEAFNLYFKEGCRTFTRHEVLAYGAAERRQIEACLANWESRGYLQMVKPFDTAQDGDVIVKLLKAID